METFLANHPGLISAAVVDEAYAHSYTSRGRIRSVLDRDYRNGVKDALTALRRDALYLPAWKLLVRIMLLASGLARAHKPSRG
jgi:hypothetical protein